MTQPIMSSQLLPNASRLGKTDANAASESSSVNTLNMTIASDAGDRFSKAMEEGEANPPSPFLSPSGAPIAAASGPNAAYKGILLAFIKQLASAPGDLSSITCPAAMMSGTSLTEYCVHWGDMQEALTAMTIPEDPLERMVAVVRWFISTLYGSYASRWTKGGNEKKPYNPILGEQFHAVWEERAETLGATTLNCEQVSHHPPMTAFHLHNTKHGVTVTGSCGQKTKFTGTAVKVEQRGGATVRFLNRPSDADAGAVESYEVTLPELHIRGLMSGTVFLELTGTVDITSSTGYAAHIDFIPKPWFSGEYHGIKGEIRDAQGNVAHVLGGKWNETTTYARPDAKGKTKAGTEQTLWIATDASGNPVPTDTLCVAPLSQQPTLSSRVVWRATTEALCAADWTAASKAKSSVEDAQRLRRKERAAKEESWKPALFAPTNASDASTTLNSSKSSDGVDTASIRSSASTTSKASRMSKKGTSPPVTRWIYSGSDTTS